MPRTVPVPYYKRGHKGFSYIDVLVEVAGLLIGCGGRRVESVVGGARATLNALDPGPLVKLGL